MPWNGSGSFSRTDGTRNGTTVWAQAKAAAVKILSADHDTHDQDLATGINNALCKDGQNSPTANLPMNSKKLTGLAAGSSAGDSVRYEQLQGEGLEYNSGVVRVKLANATIVRSASGIATDPDGFVAALAADAVALAALITALGGSVPTTGDVKPTFKAAADAGWVMLDDKTIGDASSSATGRANADTAALFALLWTNCANAQCAVSGGRGASAAADFAAHKTIALPKALGRAFASAGAGSGLTSRVLGLTTGAETHALSVAELAAHTHTLETSSAARFDGSLAGYRQGGPATGATGSAGTGDAHNNMQPTLFCNWMIKL